MALTSAPTAPDIADQATFEARSQAWVIFIRDTLIPELNAIIGLTIPAGSAAASTLTGNTLAANVVTSALLNFTTKPAFLAARSATVVDVTGNGANYAIVFDAEHIDQGANYNPANGVFTAPVAGKYKLTASVLVVDLSTAALLMSVRIVTDNRTYEKQVGLNPKTGALQQQMDLSVLADMSAGHTAYVRVIVTGMAGDTADVYGASSPFSLFCGHLEA